MKSINWLFVVVLAFIVGEWYGQSTARIDMIVEALESWQRGRDVRARSDDG